MPKLACLLSLLLITACLAEDVGDPSAASQSFAASSPPGYQPPPDDAPVWQGIRWTHATVHYVIDQSGHGANQDSCGAGQAMTQGQIDAIQAAIAEYNALGPVTFIQGDGAGGPPPAGHSFLIYRNVGSTTSAATIRGMPPDGVTANCIVVQPLANSVEGRRIILHETAHALGLDHEQQRPDRDTYLDFNPTCIGSIITSDDEMAKIFGIDPRGLLLTPYDRNSIMQYSSDNTCYSSGGTPGCLDDAGTCLQPPMLYAADPDCTPDKQTDPPGPSDCRWISAPPQLSVHDVNGLYRMYEEARHLGENDVDDNLGTALAVGDFDDDGYLDLAVGAPGQDSVFLWKGTGGSTPGSLGRLVKWKILRPTDSGFESPIGWSVGRFGAALAAGDFDGDGVTDLAVGAPAKDGFPVNFDDGTVFVYSSGKIANSPRRTIGFTRTLTQASLGQPIGVAGDHFGAALAAANLNGDKKATLFIGAPRHTIGGKRSGVVFVVPGAAPTSALQLLRPDAVPGGGLADGARFGAALVAAALNPGGDKTIDLVVGSPETGAAGQTGAVYLFRGHGDGTFTGKQTLRPASSGQEMHFGAAIAVGNFDDSTTTPVEIAIGAPNRSVTFNGNVLDEAGVVYLFKSSTNDLIDFSQSVSFRERADLASPAAGNHFGAALAARPVVSFEGDALRIVARLVVGVPGSAFGGDVEQFAAIRTDGSAQSSVSLGPRLGHGGSDRFGAALAVGNLLPDGNPFEGTEVIAGAPGALDAAGEFDVHLEGVGIAWVPFNQETAIAE